MKKELLNESEIRKMMKFANIGALSNTFVDRLNEDVEALEEETLEEEDTLEEGEDALEEADVQGQHGGKVKSGRAPKKPEDRLKSMEEKKEPTGGEMAKAAAKKVPAKVRAAQAAAGPGKALKKGMEKLKESYLYEQEDDMEDDDMGDMDAAPAGDAPDDLDAPAGMDAPDDMDMGAPDDMGAEAGGDVLELVQDALEKFVAALEAAGPAGQEAAQNLSIEAGDEGDDEMDDDMGGDMGGEEDMMAEYGGSMEEDEGPMEEEMVNEVARRVARRLRRMRG